MYHRLEEKQKTRNMILLTLNHSFSFGSEAKIKIKNLYTMYSTVDIFF